MAEDKDKKAGPPKEVGRESAPRPPRPFPPNDPRISGGSIIPKHRFAFGKYLYPGQGGINPCLCFIYFCGGTCTLQYGCVLLGLFQTFSGFITFSFQLLLLLFSHSPPVLRFPLDEGNLTENDYDDIQFFFRTVAYFSAADGIFFVGVASGVLLCLASARLSKPLCVIYSASMVVGVCYALIYASLCSVLVHNLVIPNLIQRRRDDIKSKLFFRLWMAFTVSLITELYYFMCGFSLFLQIRGGEYDMPIPPARRSTAPRDSDGKRPLLPRPPYVPRGPNSPPSPQPITSSHK